MTDPQSPPPLSPREPRIPRRFKWSATGAFIVGLAYGGLARWAFSGMGGSESARIVTSSFIFLVPFAIAAVTVYLGARTPRWSLGECIGMAGAVTLVCIFGAMLLGFETIVCVLMAAPIMIVMAIIGACVAYGIRRWWEDHRGGNGRLAIGFCALLPYLAAPVEQMLAVPHTQRTSDTSIAIAAPPEAIWPQIARVPEIAPGELR